MTEELASLKTENKDISSDVTEELASLKTENKDIVQDSINLVTQQNLERYVPESYLYDYIWKERQSARFCLILLLSTVCCKIICKEIHKIICQEMINECILESEKASIFA